MEYSDLARKTLIEILGEKEITEDSAIMIFDNIFDENNNFTKEEKEWATELKKIFFDE